MSHTSFVISNQMQQNTVQGIFTSNENQYSSVFQTPYVYNTTTPLTQVESISHSTFSELNSQIQQSTVKKVLLSSYDVSRCGLSAEMLLQFIVLKFSHYQSQQ